MDTFCLNTGIHAFPSTISLACGALDVRANNSTTVMSAVGRSAVDKSAPPPSQKATVSSSSSSRFSFRYPLMSLWPGGGGGEKNRQNGLALDDAVLVDNDRESRRRGVEETAPSYSEGYSRNWVLNILRVRSLRGREPEEEEEKDENSSEISEMDDQNDVVDEISPDDDDDEKKDEFCDSCTVAYADDQEQEFNRDSFSKMLRKVSLKEAKLYAQMSYLGNLAYSLTKCKPANILKNRGLRFVTSSVEKKEAATKELDIATKELAKVELAMKTEKTQESSENKEADSKPKEEVVNSEEPKNTGYQISASSAYQIAASAASYLHSQTRSILPFSSVETEGSIEEGSNVNADGTVHMSGSDMANFVATTDSVTSVVRAKEEVKQAVADDLNSTLLSPCEWFICDDEQSGTRFFVIQGSESLASWQANLLFEPVEFEGLEVLVHRGIYEAAKGMYDQMLPLVRAHLKSRGNHASFRFTGHSLGGSLSMLINLMLFIRGEVPVSSLLPVITFGAPSIMCGGDYLLRKLGLPRNHVQAITMHRDIVPRAFSCNYPSHVAELLKAVNKKFRNLPCLKNQKLLYAPMGELLILQPDEKFSPHHDLLPLGSGLYFLTSPSLDAHDAEKQLRAAKMVFLNSPHPLEILSDRSAYGSGGTIQRDHDMNSYLKSVRSAIRHEVHRVRKAKREQRRKIWWPLVSPRGINTGVILGTLNNVGPNQFNFGGIVHTGKESLKRFSRIITSQHLHLLVVFLVPAKLILLGAYGMISFR